MASTRTHLGRTLGVGVLALCCGGKNDSRGVSSAAGSSGSSGTTTGASGAGGGAGKLGGTGAGGGSAGTTPRPTAGAGGNVAAAGSAGTPGGGRATAAGGGGASAGNSSAAGGGAPAGSGGELTLGGSGNPGGAPNDELGTPTEEALPDLSATRQEHSVVAVGGLVYVIGGYVMNQNTASVLAYDPDKKTYASVADFPGPINHGNAGVVNGKIYVAGAYISSDMATATTQNYAYDPSTDQWTAAAPLPAGTERGAACVAVDGGNMYVIGGAHDGMSVDSVARYDAAADQWQTLAALPERREHCAAGAIGGIIYVGGGRKDGITGVEPKTYAYDPAADQWTEKAPIDPARGGLAGAVLRGHLIVFGGEGNKADPSGVFPDIDAYDPVADSWQRIGSMAAPRHGYGAAVIGERIYLMGGATKQGGGADKKSSVFYFE